MCQFSVSYVVRGNTLSELINYSTWNLNLNLYSTWNSNLSFIFKNSNFNGNKFGRVYVSGLKGNVVVPCSLVMVFSLNSE